MRSAAGLPVRHRVAWSGTGSRARSRRRSPRRGAPRPGRPRPSRIRCRDAADERPGASRARRAPDPCRPRAPRHRSRRWRPRGRRRATRARAASAAAGRSRTRPRSRRRRRAGARPRCAAETVPSGRSSVPSRSRGDEARRRARRCAGHRRVGPRRARACQHEVCQWRRSSSASPNSPSVRHATTCGGPGAHQLVAAGAPVLAVGAADLLDRPLAVGTGLRAPAAGRPVDVELDVLGAVRPLGRSSSHRPILPHDPRTSALAQRGRRECRTSGWRSTARCSDVRTGRATADPGADVGTGWVRGLRTPGSGSCWCAGARGTRGPSPSRCARGCRSRRGPRRSGGRSRRTTRSCP